MLDESAFVDLLKALAYWSGNHTWLHPSEWVFSFCTIIYDQDIWLFIVLFTKSDKCIAACAWDNLTVEMITKCWWTLLTRILIGLWEDVKFMFRDWAEETAPLGVLWLQVKPNIVLLLWCKPGATFLLLSAIKIELTLLNILSLFSFGWYGLQN